MLNYLRNLLEFAPDDGNPHIPIHNGESIDVVALREDGGVDLIIRANSHLDGSQQTQDMLEIKIKKYLQQRNTVAFGAEFHHPPGDKVYIVLESHWNPAPAIHALVRRLEPLVHANNARIMIRTQQFQKHYVRNQRYPILQRPGMPGINDTRAE